MGLVESVAPQRRLSAGRPLVLSQDRSDLVETTLEQILAGAFEINTEALREKFERRFPDECKLLEKLHLHPKSYFGRRAQSFFDPYHQRFYLADYQPLFHRLLAIAEVGSILAGVLLRRGVLTNSEEREVVARCLLLEALQPFTNPQIAQGDFAECEIKTEELRTRIEDALHKRFNLTFEEAGLLVHDTAALSNDDPAAWTEMLMGAPGQTLTVGGELVRILPRLAQSMTLSFGPESQFKGRHFIAAPLQRALAQSLDESNKRNWDQVVLVTATGRIANYPSTDVSFQGSRFLGTTFTVTVGIANALCKEWAAMAGRDDDGRDPAAIALDQLREVPVVKPKRSSLFLLTRSTLASFLF